MAITKRGGTVVSVESGDEISFQFKRVSMRRLEEALELIEDAQSANSSLPRKERLAKRDKAFLLLVGKENGGRILEECSFADVQEILTNVIEFNRVSEEELKKSESRHCSTVECSAADVKEAV